MYQAADASSHYASNHHQSSIAGMQALHVGMQIIALTSLIAMLGTLPVQKIEPKTDTHTEREREREGERERERGRERTYVCPTGLANFGITAAAHAQACHPTYLARIDA